MSKNKTQFTSKRDEYKGWEKELYEAFVSDKENLPYSVEMTPDIVLNVEMLAHSQNVSVVKLDVTVVLQSGSIILTRVNEDVYASYPIGKASPNVYFQYVIDIIRSKKN